MLNASDSQLRRIHDLDGNRSAGKPNSFYHTERLRRMRFDNSFHLIGVNRSRRCDKRWKLSLFDLLFSRESVNIRIVQTITLNSRLLITVIREIVRTAYIVNRNYIIIYNTVDILYIYSILYYLYLYIRKKI